MIRLTVEWKCADQHKDCAANDWQLYRVMNKDEADAFMVEQAPNVTLFHYRIKPREDF